MGTIGNRYLLLPPLDRSSPGLSNEEGTRLASALPARREALREGRDVRAYGAGKWTRTPIDATWSREHPPNPGRDGNRWPPVNTIDPDLERKVAARWRDYGIGVPCPDDALREQLTLEETRKVLKDL